MNIIFKDNIVIKEFLKSEKFREVKKLPRDLGKQEYCLYDSSIFACLNYMASPFCSSELAAFQLGRRYERWLGTPNKLIENEIREQQSKERF